ncbi:MAG: biotin--[acetyl-CoA-carboxylase] ligase [Bacteroidales bacterium]|jgi:BirA family biotin operon repressor/biotin-[acetyl-CoA-carboxylase] ligase
MNIVFINRSVVTSTNDEALSRIDSHQAHEGEMVCAFQQENGRGQGGNRWESEPGKNLLCSLILTPHHLVPARQFLLTQMVSLGISKVIMGLVPNGSVAIKWPNDLYVNDKKVGGILFQNIIKGNILDYAVAGIGINLNQEDFGDELPNAASLFQFANQQIPIEDFRQQMAHSINLYYKMTFSSSGVKQLEEEYLQKLYKINEWKTYRTSEGDFTGKIEGVDEYGRLVIKRQTGSTEWYQFKEIEFVF